MTFKGTSDNQNYIARTGSHATKESATGRIDAIPEWAREPEEYYNSVHDQWRSLVDQLIKTQAQLSEIREKLRATMPFREFEQLSQHRDRLCERVQILETQQVHYRELARAAATNAWAIVFFEVARKLLPPDDFRILCQDTDEMLGRPQTPIKAGYSEISDSKRDTLKRRHRQQNQRKIYRRHKTDESKLVWSENGPTDNRFSDGKNVEKQK